MKQKFKNVVDIKKIEKFVNKMPYVCIYLFLLIIPPIGVWFLIIKLTNDKYKLYNWVRSLKLIGFFVLFIIGIGLYSEIKEIIVLYDSGMSLDMINFIPEEIHLYIIGIVMCVSYLFGSKILKSKAKIEQIYTKSINLGHETSLQKISEVVELSLEETRAHIKCLEEKGYLVPIEFDKKKKKIIYKHKGALITREISKKRSKNHKIQCDHCGAIVSLKLDEYVECDFCGHGLIEDNQK